LALSFVTTAVRLAVALITSDVGGVGFKATEMPGAAAVIVIVAEAVLVVSVTEVAVTVTVAGLGGLAGAVYVVAALLAVEVGAKLPHVELPQVTVHLTPALALSFATTAVRLVVVPAASDVGGVGFKVTEIAAALIVIVAEAVFVPSLTEVATTVTVVAAAGAV
jgi:hypothetical protein